MKNITQIVYPKQNKLVIDKSKKKAYKLIVLQTITVLQVCKYSIQNNMKIKKTTTKKINIFNQIFHPSKRKKKVYL